MERRHRPGIAPSTSPQGGLKAKFREEIFLVIPLPPFCKIFRIMGFAVFSQQIPAFKEVMCLVPLNHVFAWHIFALQAAALYSLCWGNDEMIWLWIARSDVT